MELGQAQHVVEETIRTLRAQHDDARADALDTVLRVLRGLLIQQGEVRSSPGENPFLAMAGTFSDDPFLPRVDAYVAAERQRERDAAAASVEARA